MEYSNRIIELFDNVESFGYRESEIKRKRASVRGLPNDCNITADSTMLASPSYKNAVAMVTVKEMLLKETDEVGERAMTMRAFGTEKKSKLFQMLQNWAYCKIL